jgi:hypothetical protein
VTAALAAQVPTGARPFTNDAFVITPTLAAGKGFGNLNIQAATSLVIPTAHEDTIGTTWRINVAFQYQLGQIFWPEFEVNWAHWLDGSQRGGLDEVFLTVGALFGPFPIGGRVAIVVGGGFQICRCAIDETPAGADAGVSEQHHLFRANSVLSGVVRALLPANQDMSY